MLRDAHGESGGAGGRRGGKGGAAAASSDEDGGDSDQVGAPLGGVGWPRGPGVTVSCCAVGLQSECVCRQSVVRVTGASPAPIPGTPMCECVSVMTLSLKRVQCTARFMAPLPVNKLARGRCFPVPHVLVQLAQSTLASTLRRRTSGASSPASCAGGATRTNTCGRCTVPEAAHRGAARTRTTEQTSAMEVLWDGQTLWGGHGGEDWPGGR